MKLPDGVQDVPGGKTIHSSVYWKAAILKYFVGG